VRRLAAAATLLALLVLPSAAARPLQEPGVTATTVLLGATVPLSGPAAAFGALAPGAKAYFDYVNARGGVNGRKIQFRYYDDAYDPARTVQLTRQLVQQDGVLAIFASVGTANNLAVRPFLNGLKVPQLFVGDGSVDIAQPRRYPWTIPYLPSYLGEGAMYGRNLARTRPRARIAVLVESSPLGEGLLAGLRRGLAGKGQIVATERHAPTDVDVNAQVISLRGSGADTLMLFTTPAYVIQSFIQINKLGWRPQVFVNSISIEPTVMRIATLSTNARATGSTISMAWLKDPTNPRWAKDRGVVLYRTIMRRHYPSGRLTDVYNYAGMAFAHTMVGALRKAGRNLTRASLLRAATHVDERDNPFVLPGVTLRTSPTSYYPITKAQLFRYRKGLWQPFTGLLGARG
jgi:ABC-type branched-subunit amino acid transport system substrate-binding protein